MADIRLKTVGVFKGESYTVEGNLPFAKIKQMMFDHFQSLNPAIDMKKETVQLTSYFAQSCPRGYCFYDDK